MRGFVRVLARLFGMVAVILCMLALAVHVGAIAGIDPGPRVYLLPLGLLVFVPAILARFRAWRLRRWPFQQWWQTAMIAMALAYMMVNFALFTTTARPDSTAMIRGFSGHWVFFYLLAALLLFQPVRGSRSLGRVGR